MDKDTFLTRLTPEERSLVNALVAAVTESGIDRAKRGELARLIGAVLTREGASRGGIGPLIKALVAESAPAPREHESWPMAELVPRLPYPLAMAMQTLLADAERRKTGASVPLFPFQLTAVMGLLVRLIAVIAIQSYVRLAKAPDATVNQQVVTALRAPSDGKWLEVAVALLQHLSNREDTPLARRARLALRERATVAEAMSVEQALWRLIAYRNRLLHGEAVSDTETNDAQGLLLATIRGFGFFSSYRLVASCSGTFWQLTGLLPQPLSEDSALTFGQLPDNELCLLDRNGKEAPLSVAPLLVFRPGDAESPVAFDELFFLNAGVAERLEYIAYRYTRLVGGRALQTYDDFRRFLQRLPAPASPPEAKIDFSDLVMDHDRLFVGRHAVLEEIDAFVDQRPAPYGILLAQGGMGKTAILARLYTRHGSTPMPGKPRGNRWIFHFCMPLEARDNAVVALRSIIAQICEQTGLSAAAYLSHSFDELRDRFARLLHDTATRLCPGERLVVAIDAMDEGLGTHPWQRLAAALPAQLPESVLMLISYRVGADGTNALVEQSLSHIPPASRRVLRSANPLAGLTGEDVATFLGLHAPGIGIPEATQEAVCSAAARPDGGVDPFFLRFVSEGIARGRILLHRPETVPVSLDEAFDDLWLELPADRDYLVHRLLCALALMQDYGDDELFANLFSRALPDETEPLTPLEVASLRARAGKLLVHRGDRYGLMHERLRRYLVGTSIVPGLPVSGPA
jgi:hypothetical protein